MKQVLILLLCISQLFAATSCPSGETLAGDTCFADAQLQACQDHLENLDADGEDNGSIDNVCEDNIVDNRQQYDFTISYNLPYFQDDDCTTQEVKFEDYDLAEGTDDHDQWQFDSDAQEIKFSILHDDIIDTDKYDCFYNVSSDEYMWQCKMQLDILLGGSVQLEYGFFIVITLSRIYDDQLTITVEKNTVVGDCCENELNIQTTLKFCEDYSCAAYLDDGLTVERKDDVYVEHSITTEAFQYYYLHGLQLRLSSFTPNILAWDGETAGRIIYHFQSNIALDNMILEAISRIDEEKDDGAIFSTTDDDDDRRRRLENEDVGDDYKVKGTNQITVTDTDDSSDFGSLIQYGFTLLVVVVLSC